MRTLMTIMIFLMSVNANAFLPKSAVTEFSMEIYGIYTSNDPTCQKNLKATVPLKAIPQVVNFANAPNLGVGKVPKSIRCVVIVAKNMINMTVAPGNYTSTTNGISDDVCDAGKNQQSGIYADGFSVEWPAQIVSDLAALGLPAVTGVIAAQNGGEILPIYLSTYSKCAMDMFTDPGIPGCWTGTDSTTNHMKAPTVENDTSAGLRLSEPSNKSSFKFFADINKLVGADDYDNNPATPAGCGFGVPIWGFK